MCSLRQILWLTGLEAIIIICVLVQFPCVTSVPLEADQTQWSRRGGEQRHFMIYKHQWDKIYYITTIRYCYNCK